MNKEFKGNFKFLFSKISYLEMFTDTCNCDLEKNDTNTSMPFNNRKKGKFEKSKVRSFILNNMITFFSKHW